MKCFEEKSNLSEPILRITLGFVFLWFGYSGLFHPEVWTHLVPSWAHAIVPAEILVRFHGGVELIGGLLLCAGLFTRFVGLALAVILLHTIVLLDYGPIMVRDIGLFGALVALSFFPKITRNKKN